MVAAVLPSLVAAVMAVVVAAVLPSLVVAVMAVAWHHHLQEHPFGVVVVMANLVVAAVLSSLVVAVMAVANMVVVVIVMASLVVVVMAVTSLLLLLLSVLAWHHQDFKCLVCFLLMCTMETSESRLASKHPSTTSVICARKRVQTHGMLARNPLENVMM